VSLRASGALWIGVGEGVDRLRVLGHRGEEALVRVGFPRERTLFEPHVRIGRVRESRDVRGLSPALAGVRDAKIRRQRVGVAVMTSRLGPPRRRSYSPREVIALDG
jgi:2'-5' RNA ligase